MSAVAPRRLGLALALVPMAAFAQGTPPLAAERTRDLRASLESMEQALDRAVGPVSRPAIFLMGSRATRGYYLEGLGALFVVPPRALPQRTADPEAERALREAVHKLEESLTRIDSESHRAQIRASLEALRGTLAGLHGDVPGSPADFPPAAPDASAPMPGPASREPSVRFQFHSMTATPTSTPSGDDAILYEEYRVQGEMTREAAERDIRARLTPTPQQPADAPPAVSAPGVQTVGAPAARAHEGPAAIASPGAAAAEAPAQPSLENIAPPPPWMAWLGFEERDPRSAEEVFADTRKALLTALQSVRMNLRPEETITVAVDFFRRRSFPQTRPDRTLVLRVQKKDLDELQAGQVGVEEFRRRVAAQEY